MSRRQAQRTNRLNDSRRDGVHADVILGVVHRRLFGEANDCVLGYCVGAAPCHGSQAGNAGCVDDGPSPGRHHCGHLILYAVEHAPHVDTKNPVIFLEAHVCERSAELLRRNPRIVEGDVKAPINGELGEEARGF
jgi:hypothetical protein